MKLCILQKTIKHTWIGEQYITKSYNKGILQTKKVLKSYHAVKFFKYITNLFLIHNRMVQLLPQVLSGNLERFPHHLAVHHHYLFHA